MRKYEFNLITTEQVSKYHPDKYADQISDSIVALALTKNKNARCAVETLVKNDTVVVAGEIGNVELNNDEIEYAVKMVARELNYHVSRVINLLDVQSTEISQAVENENGEIGAGDQGFMVGFATRETPSYMPYGHDLANKIIKLIEKDVKNNKVLKGDAKTQITMEGDYLKTVLISACHYAEYDLDFIKNYITNLVKDLIGDADLIINPAGAWTVGGAVADSGLTGRKIVADQYGGYMAVGGGAFSGKDLTKVDRSASYTARNVAVGLLEKHKELEWVKIQVGYAIGLPYPVSLTAISNLGDISYMLNRETFRVKNMIKALKNINLYELSKGCHFG